MNGTVIVKIVEKQYCYDYRNDKLILKSLNVQYVETSPREAMDLIYETNTNATDGEELIELASRNVYMTVCHAVLA